MNEPNSAQRVKVLEAKLREVTQERNWYRTQVLRLIYEFKRSPSFIRDAVVGDATDGE